MAHDAQELLQEAIAGAGVKGLRAQVLEAIATTQDGLEIGQAPLELARVTSESAPRCNAEITELVNGGLVNVVDGNDGKRRLVVDESILDKSLRALVSVAPALEFLGARTSAATRLRRGEDLSSDDAPIFLSFDMAQPDDFPEIWSRAKRRRMTVILVPPRKHFEDRKMRELYEDSVRAWSRKVRETQDARENVDFRVLRRARPSICWSWMTPARAGFHVASSAATAGQTILAPATTILYGMVRAEFGAGVAASDPLFRIHPFRWVASRLLGLPVLVLSLGLLAYLVSDEGVGTMVAAVALGLIANAVRVVDIGQTISGRRFPT
jgi:hypothetical protein